MEGCGPRVALWHGSGRFRRRSWLLEQVLQLLAALRRFGVEQVKPLDEHRVELHTESPLQAWPGCQSFISSRSHGQRRLDFSQLTNHEARPSCAARLHGGSRGSFLPSPECGCHSRTGSRGSRGRPGYGIDPSTSGAPPDANRPNGRSSTHGSTGRRRYGWHTTGRHSYASAPAASNKPRSGAIGRRYGCPANGSWGSADEHGLAAPRDGVQPGRSLVQRLPLCSRPVARAAASALRPAAAGR